MPRFVDGAARCLSRSLYETPTPSYYPGSSTSGGGIGSGSGSLGRSHSKAAAPRSLAEDRSARAEGAPPPAAPKRAESKGAPEPYDSAAASEAAPSFDREAPPSPYPRVRAPEWGSAIYLSNDDTMSLSSAQRVIWAIDHYAPIPRSHVRPHELLNYFSFQTAPVATDHDFSVLPNIAPSTEDPNLLSLSLAIQGRPLNLQTRRNTNLAYVIDRSGSMAAEGRMEYLKRGLLRSLRELKQGDIVHLVLFDNNACDLAQNFVVGRDSMARLEQLIHQIQPLGATNLNDGLTQGYAAVDRTYQPTYTNRVVLITDAQTNTGVTDPTLISLAGKHYDERKVRLSGVGVGSDFNDSLLDSLTERGKGAYVFLGSEAEVDAVFGSRFVSLIETIAHDVHFRLHLPPSLAMQTFYGEEASVSKEKVQPIHYFANTSQLFLSDLLARDGRLPVEDDVMLSVEYQDPETGRARVEEFVWNLGHIAGRAPNLDKGMLLQRFALELGALTERPLPPRYASREGGWSDTEAAQRCYTVRSDLERLGAGLSSDPEVNRVKGLWNKFCGRYVAVAPPPVVRPPVTPHPRPYPQPVPERTNDWPAPNPPPRNNDYSPNSGWPSAQQ